MNTKNLAILQRLRADAAKDLAAARAQLAYHERHGAWRLRLWLARKHVRAQERAFDRLDNRARKERVRLGLYIPPKGTSK
jgi:hypothetical protein